MISLPNNSKELIRNRMLKHALNYWNIKNTEDLDPVVKLMLEALSTELYNLSNEIKDTEVRILEKVANLLAPDYLTAPSPAHGLLSALPVECYDTVSTTDHFYTQKKISLKKDETIDTNIEVFFTPVGNTTIVDASVVYAVTSTNLFSYDESNNKMLQAHSSARYYNDAKNLWLGLQVNNKVSQINNLNFCFDWKNADPATAQLNYQLLSLSKWHIDREEINTKPGINYVDAGEGDDKQNIFMDYDLVSILESDIKNIYNHKFISIDEPSEGIQEKMITYPAEFRDLYTENELKKLNKNLLWIKISFPAAIMQESLDEVYVNTNVFPVINRQLFDMKHRLKAGSNIIPLKINGLEQFLSIKSLTDEKNQFRSTPYKNIEEEISGTYALRSGGVERFDVRNAKEYISYLLELLRSESAAFSVYGYDFIASTLKEINQRIALMEQKTKGLAASTSEIPHYIIVKPFEGYEMMYVEYWTTIAERANFIRSGIKFQQFRTSKFKSNSLNLLTTTTGGKDRLKPEERLNAFRYGLVSRNRIVTKEDIRNFCFYELGSRINNVSIKNGIHMSANPRHGFNRTIDIFIEPKQTASLENEEWKFLCEQVEAKLTARSGMSNHYRVMLAE